LGVATEEEIQHIDPELFCQRKNDRTNNCGCSVVEMKS
jgi:hypothetical protein